jgi:hypothetical protein
MSLLKATSVYRLRIGLVCARRHFPLPGVRQGCQVDIGNTARVHIVQNKAACQVGDAGRRCKIGIWKAGADLGIGKFQQHKFTANRLLTIFGRGSTAGYPRMAAHRQFLNEFIHNGKAARPSQQADGRLKNRGGVVGSSGHECEMIGGFGFNGAAVPQHGVKFNQTPAVNHIIIMRVIGMA